MSHNHQRLGLMECQEGDLIFGLLVQRKEKGNSKWTLTFEKTDPALAL
jgi:hypothetical protein